MTSAPKDHLRSIVGDMPVRTDDQGQSTRRGWTGFWPASARLSSVVPGVLAGPEGEDPDPIVRVGHPMCAILPLMRREQRGRPSGGLVAHASWLAAPDFVDDHHADVLARP